MIRNRRWVYGFHWNAEMSKPLHPNAHRMADKKLLLRTAHKVFRVYFFLLLSLQTHPSIKMFISRHCWGIKGQSTWLIHHICPATIWSLSAFHFHSLKIVFTWWNDFSCKSLSCARLDAPLKLCKNDFIISMRSLSFPETLRCEVCWLMASRQAEVKGTKWIRKHRAGLKLRSVYEKWMIEWKRSLQDDEVLCRCYQRGSILLLINSPQS